MAQNNFNFNGNVEEAIKDLLKDLPDYLDDSMSPPPKQETPQQYQPIIPVKLTTGSQQTKQRYSIQGGDSSLEGCHGQTVTYLTPLDGGRVAELEERVASLEDSQERAISQLEGSVASLEADLQSRRELFDGAGFALYTLQEIMGKKKD